ncbi:MAG TPA: hypothetical protein VFQ39_03965, partial [Longimicrobium sp.]|nr:hypothetical protein [Longimicrobium sp.]
PAPPPFPTDHPPTPPGRKSIPVAVGLALLFGPFGLFYVSAPAAFFMLFVLVVAGLFTVGIAVGPVWIVCMAWAAMAAQHHNQALPPE